MDTKMNLEFDEKTFLKAAEHVRFRIRLMEFAKESNRIEGITNAGANERMFEKLEEFLKLEKLTVANVCEFNEWGVLRDKAGMGARIGTRVFTEGGEYVSHSFRVLINALDNFRPFYTHQQFEQLHPFTDGNGRTGRAIWLWQMVRQHDYDLSLGFLHKFYYQALSQ